MTEIRAAGFAALFFWVVLLAVSQPALAQDVTLTSRDGNVEISGDLLGFDGEFYRVDTIYGELTLDGSGVVCSGPGCPNLEAFIAQATFSGSPTIGRTLMPALVEAFAIRDSYRLEKETLPGGSILFRLSEKADDGRVLGEFEFRLTNSGEGFADLLANEADIAMSMREITQEELVLGQDAGLGDMSRRGRARVLALDALVPVVSPSNPVQNVTLLNLADILSGKIRNWQELNGPDAPIAVHLFGPETGIGQATKTLMLEPTNAKLSDVATMHPDGVSLEKAVKDDPFALGITSQAEAGVNWQLGLSGACGFALTATRRAVKTEDYPLTAPLFLYLPARRLPKLVREFIGYLREPSAQLVIRRAGFVDQAPEEIAIKEQGNRFANAIARAGGEVSLEQLQKMVGTLSTMKRLTTTFRFETGSTRLDAQSRSNVQQLARSLELGLYDARQVAFVGFSDGEGRASSNESIALRRAEAVREAVLAAAEAVNSERLDLSVVAFGEALPMACDESAWGRQVNRRVEVWVR